MARIFISYRRADSAAMSGRIYDRLVTKFKRKNVFKDVDSIPPGVNFSNYIQESLRVCSVMLLVIGREWLDIRAEDGTRRLDDPRDWVRIEIETAMALGVTILPLLVEGAAMPQTEHLPRSLADIALINALPVRNDPDFSHDMERVIAALESPSAARPSPGILRRGANSSGARSPQTPTQRTPPTQPDASRGAWSGPAAASGTGIERGIATQPRAQNAWGAVSAPPVVQPQQPVQRPLGSPQRSPRPRRMVVATVAALVILVSLGGLLIKEGLTLAGVGSNGTRAHPTATTTATQTPTLPLKVAAPGPNCADDGWSKPYWDYIQNTDYAFGTYGTTTATCDSNDTQITNDTHCSSPRCGGLSFDLSKAPLATSYTVGIDVSDFATQTALQYIITGKIGSKPVEYDFALQSNGAYTVDRAYCTPYCASTHNFGNGTLDMTRHHTLAVRVNGKTVTMTLDGNQVGGTVAETAAPTLSQALFNVQSYDDTNTADRAQVRLANFQITNA